MLQERYGLQTIPPVGITLSSGDVFTIAGFEVPVPLVVLGRLPDLKLRCVHAHSSLVSD
jgi:hypothetical protein